MKRILLLVLSITALVSALMLGTMGVASANTVFPTTQTWYLDAALGVSSFNQMDRDIGEDITASGTALIPQGASFIWVADEAAIHGITFPSGSFGLTLNTDKNWNVAVQRLQPVPAPMIDVQVGGYDPTHTRGDENGFYWFSTNSGNLQYVRSYSYISDSEELVLLVGGPSATIHEGDYLILQVTNLDTHNISHTVYFDRNGNNGVSMLSSPSSDPGYPLPEMAAGLLLGGGLIGLGGYVAIRRKKVRRMSNISVN